MTAFDACKEIVRLSEEIEELVDTLRKTASITVRERLEKSIDAKTVRIYDLKSVLEGIDI